MAETPKPPLEDWSVDKESGEITYKCAGEAEFDKFVKEIDSMKDWSIAYEDGALKVWTKPCAYSPINMMKAQKSFDDMDCDTIYDILHDAKYRKTWDENMIEGFVLEQLDTWNEVGYYSAKAPTMVTNRDFVNQRSWRAKKGEQYLIVNHSVPHKKMPEKKNFIRAVSFMTGYLLRPCNDGKGCVFTYMTQSDPKGWIPTWLINTLTSKMAPRMLDKMYKAAQGYPEWKKKHNPDEKSWLGPKA